MKFLYLMVKTHNDTGKKYLCKKETDNDDKAIKYCGSGLKWKQHIKEFGNYISTEILYKCSTEQKSEFRKIAIKYSFDLNILNDPIWMNMIIEEGQGGSTASTNGSKGKKWIYKGEKRTLVSKDVLDEYINNGWLVGFPEYFIKSMSDVRKGKPAHNKGKKMKLPHEYKIKSPRKKYYVTKSPYTSEMRSETSKKCLNRPEVIIKFKMPRKPLITAQNVNTNEIRTMGRKEWWDFDKINYKRLLKGKTYKGWKMITSII